MPIARSVVAVLVTLFAVGCGSADSTGLSGPANAGGPSSAGTAGAPSGSGGTAAGGTGAVSATTGGSAGSTAACSSDGDCAPRRCDLASTRCVDCLAAADCGVGQECVANACVDVTGSGGAGGSGMAGMGGIGTGGIGAGGVGGAGGIGTGGTGTGGTPSLPPGAWAPCSNNQQCIDGRVCTSTLQSLVVPGRSGACVQECNLLQPNACDPAPPGGTVDCTQILFAGYCSIICSNTVPCPTGFDCVSGFCFWQ